MGVGGFGGPIGDVLVGRCPQGSQGAVVVSLSLPSPADAPLPEGLSRLFAVLGDLESCHRRAEPPAPPAPALLQLQT